MTLGWYTTAMAGGIPEIPAAGHTWRTTPALNSEIWEALQASSLDAELNQLAATHARLLEIIATHSDDELFTKKRYAWTRTTSLGAYLIGATSSHYAWAATKIRTATRAWAADEATEQS